jgi:ubiquinone/menaquinone biosynthesis C-methylase UbiE
MPHPPDNASQRADMPEGTQRILNTRTLHNAHPRLAELLTPGLRVLDMGCGTGTITRGIAEAVAPHGEAIGVDINAMLIDDARRLHREVEGLRFVSADIYHLPFHGEFDIVHAARVLQWLAQPLDALRNMRQAAKPGGRVMALDYNHERIVWEPQPPPSMQVFYAAFLRWRAEAGMDNAIADHLPALFKRLGLQTMRATEQHEASQRADADFEIRLSIWAEVAATRGRQMVQDNFITEAQRAAAEADYRHWIQHQALSQRMYLISVEGTR